MQYIPDLRNADIRPNSRVFRCRVLSRPFPQKPTRRHTGRDVGAVWLGTVGTIKTIFQAPPIYRTYRTYRPSLRF